MKYKLINKSTGEETHCNKVNVDGFDYYVSDNYYPGESDYYIGIIKHPRKAVKKWDDYYKEYVIGNFYENDIFVACQNIDKKVIATNNPNIDIPKVIDEVEELFTTISKNPPYCNIINKNAIMGYNKHKETNPNSDEDVIEFLDWLKNLDNGETNYNSKTGETSVSIGFSPYDCFIDNLKSHKELFQIWKEQKVETIYYN